MRITEKEIENVLKLDPFERYKYLIKRVADTQVMYALKLGSEWAIADIDENKVFSIWSAREFALLNATGVWETYDAVEINLDFFEKAIMPLLESNGFLLNVFSINNRSGFVVELDEFIRDLNDELRNYE
ncbi:DUF2750 domain-containing protein [Chitinophaga cymbidii]|uniref:DUF2750 domain-containing protein n=1 Tax=Chitinophaga cymbidii TaxID=1096750 RepID=A0A512RRD1_9BACT|nr:DUF2750 domain-containing protein [Chitinophaga cymbidii]GEP98234.1 hypothetical protein CCY01nite_44940 [Chitinophaga cymbidii]